MADAPAEATSGGPGAPCYVELHLHTNYSLLEGASHPEELIERAAALGYRALAVTDRDNLHGALAFARGCRERGIRPIVGVELTVAYDPDHGPRHTLILLAATRQGWANLCRLVSLAHGHPGLAPTGEAGDGPATPRRRDPCLARHLLAAHAAGLVCLTGGRSSEVAAAVEAGDPDRAAAVLGRLVDELGPANVVVELQDNLVHGDRPRNRSLVALAHRLGLSPVATGDVHYHDRSRHRLHDVLCAIRHRTTLDASHRERRANGEFYLRGPAEQQRRFAEWPHAVAAAATVATRCGFPPRRCPPGTPPTPGWPTCAGRRWRPGIRRRSTPAPTTAWTRNWA
jgi:error-prone DNA polymerase